MMRYIHSDKLSESTARNAMGVLFQHSLILVVPQAEQESLFEFSVPRAFLRLCSAHFLRHAKMAFGDASEIVVSLFLEHGKLSLSALRSLLQIRFPTISTTIFEEAIQLLLTESYILPCSHEQALSGEQECPEDMPLAKRMKKSTATPTKSTKDATHSTPTGPTTPSAASASSGVNSSTLYRLCVFHFLHALRCEAIQDSIRLRLQAMDVAAKIVEVMMQQDASRVPLVESGEKLSPFAASSSAVSSTFLAKKMNTVGTAIINANLTALQSDQTGSLLTVSNTSAHPMYSINFQRVCTDLQMRMLESVMMQRFDKAGLRIARMLCRGQLLEERVLGERCMLPPHLVREKLYAMQDQGFTRLQQVPRTVGPERNPKDTIFLWGFSFARSAESTLDSTYHALRVSFNRLRLAGEMEQLGHVATASCDDDDRSMVLGEASKERLVHALTDLAHMVLVLEYF
eukprot:PhM_4_TR10464/c0_g1_i5/m.17739/K03023/RPC3, POLR3C; DNA-directed RNA polymerase III subunit RPC3